MQMRPYTTEDLKKNVQALSGSRGFYSRSEPEKFFSGLQ